MRNLRLEIEYDGTRYCGWQIQTGNKLKPSIQSTLEKALQKILQEKIKVIGSGRTDAGVHAFAQAVNFKTTSPLSLKVIQRGLNALLPEDMVVRRIARMPGDFHARYSARFKLYRYFILNSPFPSVFWSRFSWHIPYKLDMQFIRQEARALLGRHDFKSFCASNSRARDTVRTMKGVSIKQVNYNLLSERLSAAKDALSNQRFIIIDVEANGFLYNMVRNIVGTLVDIGRHRLRKGALKKILLAGNRRLAGQTAPAKGLFLMEVKY